MDPFFTRLNFAGDGHFEPKGMAVYITVWVAFRFTVEIVCGFECDRLCDLKNLTRHA